MEAVDRFFYQPDLSTDSSTLSLEESHHALRVLRMQVGDEFAITNGRGLKLIAQITGTQARKCTFTILSQEFPSAPPYSIHLAIAPTKNNDRLEWMLEKLTEIGIQEVTFLMCHNNERAKINRERFEKVVISAMKQSKQSWLPKLNPLTKFSEVLKLSVQQKFIARADTSDPEHLKKLAKPNGSYLILIGPEGDFTDEETTLALEAGFSKASLGSTRLRTETAGLVASQVLHFIQD
jgi:16S rRNA (uracil1498-N3)-methyltransferase